MQEAKERVTEVLDDSDDIQQNGNVHTTWHVGESEILGVVGAYILYILYNRFYLKLG